MKRHLCFVDRIAMVKDAANGSELISLIEEDEPNAAIFVQFEFN